MRYIKVEQFRELQPGNMFIQCIAHIDPIAWDASIIITHSFDTMDASYYRLVFDLQRREMNIPQRIFPKLTWKEVDDWINNRLKATNIEAVIE